MYTQPVISTVVLNWNRSDLLQKTLESYLQTVSVPFEIFIVDNASSDDSRVIIDRFSAAAVNITPILLDTNMGGEAINLGLEKCKGSLLHISENDLEYLPGWSDQVVNLFNTFPRLGQLSLFGPVPDDDEIWHVKPSVLRHRKGRIIYEALSNVGTSSVLSREVWDQGVRIVNLDKVNDIQFPRDVQLSQDVKDRGFIVAWADHYLVRNLGHSAAEFESRPDYYEENYRSKPWIGETGWRARITDYKRQARPVRASFLTGRDSITAEMSFPSNLCPEPRLWSMLDGKTPEIEVLEFLYGLVRMVKPVHAIETGAWRGYTAVTIGRALKENGRGKLVALEPDPDFHAAASQRIEEHLSGGLVDVVCQNGASFTPAFDIDLLLLDSHPGNYSKEFRHFLPLLKSGCIIVFFETNSRQGSVMQNVARLAHEQSMAGFFFPTPRGLAVCQYLGSPNRE
jgi:predicted O-methyltransferase YrrM